MYGNPSSAGMGQGAAQVFNTSGVVNAYIQTAMIERQQRQMEQQQLAKMLAQFDPSKLRPQDIPSFNKKYEELKNLYITNKGLYTNPMKNPQAYRRATELVGELNMQAQDSKAYQAWAQEVSKEGMKNRNRFAPNFVERFSTWNNLSTEEIKQMSGGRLPDYSDVEFIPDEPKPAEMKALVRDAAQSIGGLKTIHSFVTSDQDPSLPKFERKKISEETIDPAAIPHIANAIISKPVEEQRYEYMWNSMAQDQKNTLRLEAASAFPDMAHKMTGAQIAATMDLYRNYRTLDRKEVTEDNTEALRNDAERIRKDNQSFQRQMQRNSQSFQRSMQSRQQKFEVDKPNLQKMQTKEMLDGVVKAVRSGDQAAVERYTAPLYQLAASLESGVNVIDPTKMSEADFVKAVSDFKGDPKADQIQYFKFYDIDADEAKAMYKDKVPVIAMKTAPSDGNAAKVLLINPSKKNMDAGLMSITNIIGGGRNNGFAQGFEGFTQPKTKK